MRYAGILGARNTPQSEALDERQVENNAGGYGYAVTNWQQLSRFLILGSAGGTYYVGERKLTKMNAEVITSCLGEDYEKTIETIVGVSDGGKAPKNDPAVFALAVAASDPRPEVRKYALRALPRVCRIPTHLFQFVAIAQDLRGWGRGLRTAVGNWYNQQTPEHLAYEIAKYQQREGWSNRDLLRLAHPKAVSPEINRIFRYIVKGFVGLGEAEQIPNIIRGVEIVKNVKDPKKIVEAITQFGLTREMIPTESLNSVEVWRALLENMPITAMIRNLGKMTSIGLLNSNLNDETKAIVARLKDPAYVRGGRVHPVTIMMASSIYEQGHGDKGKLSWTPVPAIVDALDAAFYLAFHNVAPTGKNILTAIDISGSMGANVIAGTKLNARVASAAMALIIARTEPYVETVAFSAKRPEGSVYRGSYNWESGIAPFAIHPNDRFQQVIKNTDALPFGGTDCALPMLYAMEKKLKVDAFITITDNESWAGRIHPKEALRQYRDRFNPKAKMIVMAMTADKFSVNDPSDPLGLDVVGFDSSVPAVMSEFIRG